MRGHEPILQRASAWRDPQGFPSVVQVTFHSALESALKADRPGTPTGGIKNQLSRTALQRAQKTDSPWAHTKGKTLQRLFNHYNLEFFITGLDLFVVVFILFCFLMCHGRSKRLRVSWGKTLRGTPWLLLCCELQHSTFSLSHLGSWLIRSPRKWRRIVTPPLLSHCLPWRESRRHVPQGGRFTAKMMFSQKINIVLQARTPLPELHKCYETLSALFCSNSKSALDESPLTCYFLPPPPEPRPHFSTSSQDGLILAPQSHRKSLWKRPHSQGGYSSTKKKILSLHNPNKNLHYLNNWPNKYITLRTSPIFL